MLAKPHNKQGAKLQDLVHCILTPNTCPMMYNSVVKDKSNGFTPTIVTTKITIPPWKQYDPSKPWEAWVPDPYRYDKMRIHEEANKNGFEIYYAGRMGMGMGLRTTRPISKTSTFPYAGKRIELDVDSETGKYVGYPKDCSYSAEFISSDGRAYVVDALDLTVRNFTAYANHGGKHANARLLVSPDDVLVMQMIHDTPADVPVYVDYGQKYYAGREGEVHVPTDAWKTPCATNGYRWQPPI